MRRRPKAPTETTVLPEQGGTVRLDAPAESFWNVQPDAESAAGTAALSAQHHRVQPAAMPGGAPGSATGAQPLGQYTGQLGAPHGAAPSAPLSAEPEYTIVRVRRHGRHLTFPVLVLIAVAGLAGLYVGTLPELWMNVLAGAGAVAVALLLGIGPLFGWLTRRTVITTRRVIVHRGFFVRHRTEVSLMRVREVRSRQNLVQRMWGSGDVDLYVGTEATRIHDAPRVKELHAALRELSEHSYDEQQRQASFAL